MNSKLQRHIGFGLRPLTGRRLIIFTLAIIGILWIAGFALFTAQIRALGKTTLTGNVEGIVVLAGGRGRVGAGMAALEEGMGQRLLLSGVDPVLPRDTILAAFQGAETKRDCCIDLGRVAVDTEGNAVEALEWAAQHNFNSLMVVTADYHMPRAITEFRCRSARVAIMPLTVKTEAGLALLLAEYSKYTIRLVRPCWL